MLNKTYPYYLANVAVAANTDLEVTDKFSGEVATRVAMADAAAIDKAIGYAVDAMPAMRTDSSAATLNVSIRRVTSPLESLIGLPASIHNASASSS